MLISISWQQYLTAVLLLTGSYYFYIALRYYQSELASFLKGHGKHKSPVPFHDLADGTADIIGKARQEPVITLTDDKNVIYSNSPQENCESEIISKTILETEPITRPDLTANLEADIANLINASKDDEDKNGFLVLIKALINAFQKNHPEVDLSRILDWAIEHANEKLRFTISVDDLQKTDN